MKKIEKMFQVGGKISGRSGYRKHNIFFATPNSSTRSHPSEEENWPLRIKVINMTSLYYHCAHAMHDNVCMKDPYMRTGKFSLTNFIWQKIDNFSSPRSLGQA